MRQRDLIEGATYSGSGRDRQIQRIEVELSGRLRVHWAATSDEWGSCRIESFARWARSRR